jgi:hypothetical protein
VTTTGAGAAVGCAAMALGLASGATGAAALAGWAERLVFLFSVFNGLAKPVGYRPCHGHGEDDATQA